MNCCRDNVNLSPYRVTPPVNNKPQCKNGGLMGHKVIRIIDTVYMSGE